MISNKVFVEIVGLMADDLDALRGYIQTINADAEIRVRPVAGCDECGKTYMMVRKAQRFCSRRCANRFRVRKHRRLKNMALQTNI